MARDHATLLDEAMRLPADARARLAAALLRSLDDEDELPETADHEAAWDHEVAERLRAADAGEVQPSPWAEARLRLIRDE